MSVHRDRDAWRVRWRENGRPRSRTFTLKRDADAFDREIKRRRQLGPLAVQQLTDRGPTLGEWIEQRWTPEHGVTLEQSTRDRYANAYAIHVAPWLDEAPLGELTVARLRAWQADRVAHGVSAGTIHKARTFLSSVLRHAAESEAILANPLALVRAPKAEHKDAVTPLAPATIEKIRAAMLNPAAREVAASRPGQRFRRRYTLPAPGDTKTRMRDAGIVSVLAYAGLRPGELRALRWGDIRERTLHVERAAGPDGKAKATKNTQRRSVRLLAPLAQDLRELRLATGRPPDKALVLRRENGKPWDKKDWQVWRRDRWAPACLTAGLSTTPRPYDSRHSFASLLLAEGRQPIYVAGQLGHSLAVLLSTYAHLIAEYADADRIDAEAEITKARGKARSARVPRAVG